MPEHDHEDFDSTIIELGEIDDPDRLVEAINRLAETHKTGVKGYAAVTDKPMRLLIQAVGSRIRTQYDRMCGRRANNMACCDR